jgi:hypothetical protein
MAPDHRNEKNASLVPLHSQCCAKFCVRVCKAGSRGHPVLWQLKLVLEGAQNAAVKKFVVLSTNKAFQQVSPYRHSKALAESIFFAAANTRRAHGPTFSVARYSVIAFVRILSDDEARQDFDV